MIFVIAESSLLLYEKEKIILLLLKELEAGDRGTLNVTIDQSE